LISSSSSLYIIWWRCTSRLPSNPSLITSTLQHTQLGTFQLIDVLVWLLVPCHLAAQAGATACCCACDARCSAAITDRHMSG
jgi:hypothetical protein